MCLELYLLTFNGEAEIVNTVEDNVVVIILLLLLILCFAEESRRKKNEIEI